LQEHQALQEITVQWCSGGTWPAAAEGVLRVGSLAPDQRGACLALSDDRPV